MLTLRIYGYALAVSFCFITLIAASQRTDPSEGVFFYIKNIQHCESFYFTLLVLLCVILDSK